MRRNLILTDGGAGDLICQLVAVDYLIKRNKKVKFEVWVPDYLHKFAIHTLQYTQVYPFSQAKDHFDGTIPGRTTEWFAHGHTPMRTHPVDYGFHMLADCHIYDITLKNYLQIRSNAISVKEFNLPNNYVVIASTAAEPVKTMPYNTFTAVVDHVVAKGYTPVYLGKTASAIGYKNITARATAHPLSPIGINLIDKTDLLQSANIIDGAHAYIGMDSGLTHLAGCTETDIIAGYTLASPDHLAPIRASGWFYAIEPDLDIPNRYFQTETSYYDGDYRTFPGWEKVVASLTPEKFIKAIDKVL